MGRGKGALLGIAAIAQLYSISLQRPVRQDNGWDCGPFVAADLVSLLTSDCPSEKTQRDMPQWRKDMAACVASLRIDEVVKAVRKAGTASAASDFLVIE